MHIDCPLYNITPQSYLNAFNVSLDPGCTSATAAATTTRIAVTDNTTGCDRTHCNDTPTTVTAVIA
jgi:siroheme synthase